MESSRSFRILESSRSIQREWYVDNVCCAPRGVEAYTGVRRYAFQLAIELVSSKNAVGIRMCSVWKLVVLLHTFIAYGSYGTDSHEGRSRQAINHAELRKCSIWLLVHFKA